MLYAIGQSYQGLGLYKQSASVLEESKAVADRILGKDSIETLKIDSYLNEAYSQSGRRAEAIPRAGT